MSKNTIEVDQFILNKLQPEIDALNLSLVSMEEYGYSNKAILDTRNKLNKLITVYDFLKEYAYGNEETEDTTINKLLKISGASALDPISSQSIVQNLRYEEELNSSNNSSSIRVYLDNRILTSGTITSTSKQRIFKVYAPDTTTKIEVIVKIEGLPDETFEGKTYITIPNIALDIVNNIEFIIKTYRYNDLTKETSLKYKIAYNDCDLLSFFYGATIERFSISNTAFNESTELAAFNPNQGTLNPITAVLDYNWFKNDFNLGTEKVFESELIQTFIVEPGSAHALILAPISLEITNLAEVVLGTSVALTQGIHYDILQITNNTQIYNCVYLRDLTDMIFPERTFQFTIKQI